MQLRNDKMCLTLIGERIVSVEVLPFRHARHEGMEDLTGVDMPPTGCMTHTVCVGAAGVDDEFVFVGRLDNLAMSYCSLQVRD